MPTSRRKKISFHNQVETLRQKREETERLTKAAREHLEEISADTRGSDLEDFMTLEDAKLCQEFLEEYGDKPNPRKTTLKLEVAANGEKLWGKGAPSVYPGVKIKPKPLNTGMRYKKVPLKTVWEGEGFLLDHANGTIIQENFGFETVYLCTDGKLRCTRNVGIFPDSYATGVGTLPEHLSVNPEESTVYTDVGAQTSEITYFPAELAQVLAHIALEAKT